MKSKLFILPSVLMVFTLNACSQQPPEVNNIAPTVEINPPTKTVSQSEDSDIRIFKIISEESNVSYEVGEIFINRNNQFNVAIGNTVDVSGEITINVNDLMTTEISEIRIDISMFVSDSSRRDRAIQEKYLESNLFPIAVFIPKEITGIPNSYGDGKLILEITGDLTVRDVTKPVTFITEVSAAGNQITGHAATTILMSDFGVGPISILGILKTEDEVKINFDFIARD